MNHNTKCQHHEQARKKHKHDQQHNARAAAKLERSPVPRWFLIVGVALMILLVVGSVFFL
jgi:hypothetical protein